jgi:hypothetical protein
MAMALTQAPRTGALAPMGVGAARLFFKDFFKALLSAVQPALLLTTARAPASQSQWGVRARGPRKKDESAL